MRPKLFFKFMLPALALMLVTQQSNAQTITSNQTGTNNGFYYSFWTNGGGSVSMTLGSAGNYSVNWSNVGDFTCGKGWSTGSGHTVSYNAGVYQNSGGGALAIYGWTTNPLIEYYICESWNGVTYNASQMGTVSSDGGTYTIWRHQQVNQPSIIGNGQTFWQYIDTRQSQRTSGTITIQNHFNAWASHGMNLGSMNYQILLTEGWSGSGQSNVTVWEGGSSSGGSSSGGSSGGSSSGGSTGSGSNTVVVHARGTSGNERIQVTVGGSNVGSFTLGTSLADYTVRTNNTGDVRVQYTNDGSNMDVDIPYVTINGTQLNSASMTTNTGSWNSNTNSCGGVQSEWLYCNGYIDYGNMGGGGGGSSSGGSSGGGGSHTIIVHARGTSGQEQIRLHVGSNWTTVATWTLSTSLQDYTASTSLTGGASVEFFNDASGRDVDVPYIIVDGRQENSADQSTNTGAWNSSTNSCGGIRSEWLHCNGYIGYLGPGQKVSANGDVSAQKATGEEDVPVGYALEQSYPNPFNPTTTITFAVPKENFVSLKVYNSVGQLIAELAGREFSAGRHSVTFNASNLASGEYFYAMKSGTYTMVRKMILQK